MNRMSLNIQEQDWRDLLDAYEQKRMTTYEVIARMRVLLEDGARLSESKSGCQIIALLVEDLQKGINQGVELVKGVLAGDPRAWVAVADQVRRAEPQGAYRKAWCVVRGIFEAAGKEGPDLREWETKMLEAEELA